jgi:hypothetical protein
MIHVVGNIHHSCIHDCIGGEKVDVTKFVIVN